MIILLADAKTNLIIGFVTTLVVIVIFMIVRFRRSVKFRLKKQLAPYNNEIRKIVIPDGIGGELEIEHLIASDHGLLLIQTLSMEGNVFGAENMQHWSLVMKNGKRYKFNNPLQHLSISRQALKLLAPNVPVFAQIVFSSDTQFPKGIPDEISTLNTLSNNLSYITQGKSIPTQVQQKWDDIVSISHACTQI